MSKKDIEDRIKRYELSKPNNNASDELFKRIQAMRDCEGYKSDYECLVELGVIEEVVAPPNAVNLFDTMKKKRLIVQEALKDPTVKAKVEAMQADFKEQCKREGVLYDG